MLLSEFSQQLAQHFASDQHFVVGLSGGVDSVVLLHLFHQAGKNVRVLHIHHGISPNADQWANFCETLCSKWKIRYQAIKVNIEKNNNIESQARETRYKAIKENLLENEVFVTAHHQDDQAETFLLALKRGNGVKGLGAMQAVSFSHYFALFRPLLNTPKSAILRYAQQHALQWIEDESNADNRYDRNFLRNEILPKLNQRWQFSEMAARTAKLCAEQQNLLDELLVETLAKYANLPEKALNVRDFTHFSPNKQQALLRLWLEKCAIPMPSLAQMQQITQNLILANRDRYPEIQLGDHILRRYRNVLYLTENRPNFPEFETKLLQNSLILPDDIGEIWQDDGNVFYKKGQKTHRLQLPESLKNETLIIRLAYQGKVQEYGKNHHEEMKKIWQRYGVPQWERARTPLIFWQGQLVAAITTFSRTFHSE